MNTLISATDLLSRLREADAPVVLDCSFNLSNTDAGEMGWREGHIAGARYLHLDRDMAGAKEDGQGRFLGRHPLPDRAKFAQRLGELGITPTRSVVCYDAQGGMYAARAWWLLRWMGHADATVLDGGAAAWREAGGAMTADVTAPKAASPYPAQPPALPTIDADTLQSRMGRVQLIDARGGDRFRGEVEPLDRAAGHIPGARNRPFSTNLEATGRFKSADVLRAEWTPLLAGGSAGDLVQQCGSGVTACHNLLALAHAGLGDSVLYPGSWSEWSADPARPQAKG